MFPTQGDHNSVGQVREDSVTGDARPTSMTEGNHKGCPFFTLYLKTESNPHRSDFPARLQTQYYGY